MPNVTVKSCAAINSAGSLWVRIENRQSHFDKTVLRRVLDNAVEWQEPAKINLILTMDCAAVLNSGSVWVRIENRQSYFDEAVLKRVLENDVEWQEPAKIDVILTKACAAMAVFNSGSLWARIENRQSHFDEAVLKRVLENDVECTAFFVCSAGGSREKLQDLNRRLGQAPRGLNGVAERIAALPILLSGRAGKCLEDLDYHLSAAARTLNGVVEWEVACPLEPVKPTCVHATGHGESHHANAGTPVELRLTHLAIALGLIGILLFGSGWMRKQDRLDHRGRAALVLERELEREVPRRVSLLCGFRVRLQDQQRKFGRARGIPAGDV